MSDATLTLFIELVQEEIPARMQDKAAANLSRLVTDRLKEANLGFAAADHMVSPRHMALCITGLDARQADRVIEKRGPRVDAPEQAINGFLSSTGLTRDQLVEEDTPKGRFLFVRSEAKGAPTTDLLAAMITGVLAEFPWPKSQRWGSTRFRWVRPLHRVNVLVDGAVLEGALDLGGGSIAFGGTSCGHYFESPDDIDLAGVTSLADYAARMGAGHVIVDGTARRAMITEAADALASAKGTTVRRGGADLTDEIAGLVEYPHPIYGAIEDRFMALPDEVLEASIKAHQKYLTLSDADGKLANGFIVVSNRRPDAARDAVILAGNQRVLRARLADAEFFWNEDGKTALADYLPKLADVTFYEGLGSVYDKAMRLEKLAADIAPYIEGADTGLAARAARLAKADLVTGMVGEFPELQGVMGGYYARLGTPDTGGTAADADTHAVADAIADHYRPQGPADSLPSSALALVVSLADKIDSLTGFFGVGAKPTGSKDPFALRRAALGVIRIIRETGTRLPLAMILDKAAGYHGFAAADADLLPFIRERLRVTLRDDGLAHDVIAAAFGDGDSDDVLLLADRAASLNEFLTSADGAGLMAGWRRAASILAAEESKSKQVFSPDTDPTLFAQTAAGTAEKDLHQAILGLGEDRDAAAAITRSELSGMMVSLGQLRTPIDRFFDDVVVNDDDPAVRLNRLGLLAMVRHKMLGVADFTKLEG